MDNGKINEAIEQAAAASGHTDERFKRALRDGDVDAILNALSPEQAARLKMLLSDPKAAKDLLSSPQAAVLLKSLLGRS